MTTAQQIRPAEVARVTADATTMRAIVQDAYGEADVVLHREQIEKAVIGGEEVLIRVHAAGLDRGVWHIMAGLPYPIPLAGYGRAHPRPAFAEWTSPGASRRSARTSPRCSRATMAA